MALRPELSKQEWAEHVAAKVAEAQETLAAELKALQSGEDWKRYLGFQASLHSYSAGNAMLIFRQHAIAHAEGRVISPEPTYVAGFNTWRALGRSVDKGQHGYAVLAPCRYDRQVAVDADGKARRLGTGEAPATGETVERDRVLGGFRVEHVFDVSQTSGAELPEPRPPVLLEGAAPAGLGAAVLTLIEERGYQVDVVESAAAIGGANGQTNWGSKTVLVRVDMDEAAMVKTLIHEAAHVLLHASAPGMYAPRPLKEVEAESVAYVVASAHGMSTGDYSFPYVATWVGADTAKAVQATQQRVSAVARRIIEASPAPHISGGKVPGAEAAVAAAKARRSELETRLAPAPSAEIGGVVA
jgi:N-terminal domain of anti-restriction factor ArdC